MQLAYNTTFGVNGTLTCVWMDSNYNWSDPIFKNRVGQSINLAVNYVTDVLHTLYLEATQQPSNNTQQSLTTHILINEVELNPAGTDAGNEWVELYNPTTETVDIGSYTLSTTAGITVTCPIPPGTVIEGRGYCVVTCSVLWLDNEGESVILRDAGGKEIDRTPLLSDTYDDGRSWQRCPDGQDTGLMNDWSFKTSTMGSSNGGPVTKTPSSISISVSPTNLTVGTSLTVTGMISPALAGVAVTIDCSYDGRWSTLATVTSSSDGSYSYTWTPASTGSYQLRATWAGDATHDGATSAVVAVTISKISTSISCRASLSEINLGGTIVIAGSITPPVSGKVVTLIYTKPDGGTLIRTAATGPDGSYSDSYKVDEVGLWHVAVSWEGDLEHQGAISHSVSFSVKSGCVIATATYGSESAPQVQFLRDFRENVALKTFAGSSFMTAFNAWYYSWSPSVASLIAPDPTIKAIMRIVLQPLLNILQAAAAIFFLFTFNTELGIVMVGLAASALIGLVYFAPIATIVLTAMSRWRGHAPRVCRIKFLAVPWSVSLILILFAELSASMPLMMAATSAFVIFTIATVAGSVALKMASLMSPKK